MDKSIEWPIDENADPILFREVDCTQISAVLFEHTSGFKEIERKLDHAEVMETAARVRGQFISLLETIIGRL